MAIEPKKLCEISVAGSLDTDLDYVVVTHDNGDTTFTDYLMPASFFQPAITPPNTPTLVLGTGAGSGATYNLINCTDKSGIIEIITSGTPVTPATIATLTFGTPYATEVNVCFSGSNGNAAVVSKSVSCAMENTHKLGFTINCNAVGSLNTGLTYRWSYIVL